MQTEKVDIPILPDNVILKGSIYYSENAPHQAPWIINCPGLLDHRESYFVQFYSEKFANFGYYVLSYDYRAHGETAQQTGKNWLKQVYEIFSDIHHVITWIIEKQSHRLLGEKIALFGRSIGGAMILTHGYIDQRAKKLIALCARYDYSKINIKFPEDIIKKISPKYFLNKQAVDDNRILIAHCKDDERIPFENFQAIKEHLGLNDEKAIAYETGGHSFKEHREDLFLKSIAFLKDL
jgi:esterase/lipase